MSTVKYEEQDNIAIVTISRPEALNALNSQVLDDLSSTFKAIDTKKIRAVILTGDGPKSFVAGADIAEMSEMSEKEAHKFSKKGNDLFRYIETFPLPVIAAVNGFALGGGNEIAMSCDIRIASENAVFGQPEVGLGITPGFGGTQRLFRLIPTGKAKEMIYAARNIKADEAYRIGLVNAVYPAEELLEQAKKLAQNIAKNAPIAVQACKRCINEGSDTDVEGGLKIEEKEFSLCFNSNDQKLGMKSFLAKEKGITFNNN